MKRWRQARKQGSSFGVVATLAKAAAQADGSFELRVVDAERETSKVAVARPRRKNSSTPAPPPPPLRDPTPRAIILPRVRPTLSDAHKAVCDVFGWSGCIIVDVSDEGDVARGYDPPIVESDAQLARLVDEYNGQEDARKRDLLEAHLERARSRLLSTRTDQVVLGAHTLWELACRPANHSQLGASSFELLLDAMH